MNILYRKINILLIVSILSITLLTTVAGLLSANKLINKDAHQILKLMNDSNSVDINAWFESVESAVNFLYTYAVDQLPKDEALWKDEKNMNFYFRKLYGVLENAAHNTESAECVYLRVNPDLLNTKAGLLLVRNIKGRYDNVPVTDLALYGNSDKESFSWWSEPIKQKKAVWIKPYYNKNLDIEMISYVIPIYINETFFGVIGMDIDFKKLIKRVSSIKLYQTGDAMLINEAGEILFSNRFDNFKKRADYETEIEKIRNTKNFAYDNVSQSYIISIFEEKIYFSVTQLINNMKLVIMVPKKEINKDRDLLILQCIIIIIIGLIISIIFCSKFISKLIKSLEKITASVQEIARGNYQVSVEIGEKNEFGELARTFNEAAREVNKSNKQINKLAYTDSLTGLKNRNCFNKFCAGLDNSFQKNIGVIFCDLNRLKYTNDNYGHQQGDKLICKFANILRENFSHDECFRMSGDEFIVVSLGQAEISFEEKVKEYIQINNKEKVPLASIGSCWKLSTENLNSMVNEAEANMYRDKNEFYKRFPQFKR